MRLLPSVLAATLVATTAAAAPQVEAAWSRPAAQGTTGAGFLTLSNPKGPADALIGIESPLSGHVMIHQTTMTPSGVSSMAMVSQVPVPAGGRVTFSPGGYHLMFMGLTKALNVGDSLPATLTFSSGAKVKTAFVVGLTTPAAPRPTAKPAH